MGKSIWDFVAPIAGAALGSVIPGIGTAIGGAIGSGLETGIKTNNPLAGLLSAGGSFVGGNLGGSVLGGSLGDATVGSALSSGLGSDIGSFAGNMLPEALSGATLGSIGGASLGSTLGGAAGQALMPPSTKSSGPAGEAAFKPKQQAQLGLPQSLSQFGNLSPDQLTSNIATQGVYGGGNGPQENQYFLNLINRQLVDQSGKTGDMGQLSGIDNSYLSQLGLGGMGNTNDLLKGIQNYSFS